MKRLLILLLVVSFLIPQQGFAETGEETSELAEVLATISIDQTWDHQGFSVSHFSVDEYQFDFYQDLAEDSMVFAWYGYFPLLASKERRSDDRITRGNLAILNTNENKIRVYNLKTRLIDNIAISGEKLIVERADNDHEWFLFNPKTEELEPLINWDEHREELFEKFDLENKYKICGSYLEEGEGLRGSTYGCIHPKSFNVNDVWDDFISRLRIRLKNDGQVFAAYNTWIIWLHDSTFEIFDRSSTYDFKSSYGNSIYSVYDPRGTSHNFENLIERIGSLSLGMVDNGIYLQDTYRKTITRIGYTNDDRDSYYDAPYFVNDRKVVWFGQKHELYIASIENRWKLEHTGVTDIPRYEPFRTESSSTVFAYRYDRNISKYRLGKFCAEEVFELTYGKSKMGKVVFINDDVEIDFPEKCDPILNYASFRFESDPAVYAISRHNNLEMYCNKDEYFESKHATDFRGVHIVPDGSIEVDFPVECGHR